MTNTTRLQVVDALRGFAIVSIMLLHNIEHFDFYFTPVGQPAWLISINQLIWDTLFFLFSGKSYAIFALLFGLTYFIQNNNQQNQGKDFRGRFAWRLVLLLLFGFINSAFYQGDILTFYALIGFFLIPFTRLSNRFILVSAIVLLLQPLEWFNLIYAINHPEIKVGNPVSWSYFGKMGEYVTKDSFWDTLKGNLTNGRIGVILWTWESGRVFQTLALFLLGFLAGRTKRFSSNPANRSFWRWVLFCSTLCFIPLYLIKNGLGTWITSKTVLAPLSTIEGSLTNFAFMLLLVSLFVLLFEHRTSQKVLSIFSPIGKMSLSNYIIQSILGSSIYYGFGLGLYQYTGATYCLFIGLGLAILQGFFSKWWMSRHKQGPLETIWHRLTWI